MVRFDRALGEVFCWKKVPCTSTYTRFFHKFNRERTDAVFFDINRWFWEQIPQKTITVDLGSTVLTRYGKQEGSERGFNPRKRGRPSHHPVMAFAADLRMVIHSWLRPGNTGTINGACEFVEETKRILGNHVMGLFRADSGFFSDGAPRASPRYLCLPPSWRNPEEKPRLKTGSCPKDKFLRYLETQKHNYIIAAKMNSQLRNEIVAIKTWVRIDKGIESSECRYQAQEWETPRRIIVIRQRIEDREDAKGKLLFALPGYRYQAYVSNLVFAPLEVWRLYRGRADSENRIAELKYDFGITGFCLNSFYATEAAFRMVMVSYNLMSLFRQVLLKALNNATLSTIRFKCFAIGAWVGRKAHERVLRLSLPVKRRAWFEGLFDRTRQFPVPFPITS